ncbi:hypothetical protein HZC07_00360 [Candidatus Micrarchaeota archaeon]|nr:hypothetical protein [Candidatus Micrarchaeota archaeon]
MDYTFVLLLLIGAFGAQMVVAWLSKNEFNMTNFIMLVPIVIITQYFIAWGYNSGTIESSFITVNILWMGLLVIATLVVNYLVFQNIPSLLSVIALMLSAVAAVIAVMGK